MKFKLLEPGCEPYKKYFSDAGYDLKASVDAIICPGETVKIGAGIAVEIPYGYVGDISPRSSVSLRGLVIQGKVDPEYRGEVGIIVTNASNKAQRIARGERIAQLVVLPCLIEEIDMVDELGATERNANGFGSTGK